MLFHVRAYPSGFAQKLLQLYEERRNPFPAHLRHRTTVDVTLTDRQLFDRLTIGDVWLDAGLHYVWAYLYSCPSVQIPPSWVPSMRSFDEELRKVVTCPIIVAPFLLDLSGR